MRQLQLRSSVVAVGFLVQASLPSTTGEQAAVLPKVEWREASDGALGVFATQDYDAGALVERCYAAPIEYSTMGNILAQWVYLPKRKQDSTYPESMALFAWGWCMLYNQAPVSEGSDPNLEWVLDEKIDAGGHPRYFINLVATRPLKVGEELLFARQHNNTNITGLRDIANILLQDGLKIAKMETLDEDSTVENKDEYVINGPVLAAPQPQIEMRFSELHGCGIFAARDFKEGELIEVSPCLTIDMNQILMGTLGDYFFQGYAENVVEVALGFGSIYNHMDEPNVLYSRSKTSGAPGPMRYSQQHTAARDIAAGEELFISYGEHWWAGANRSMPQDRHAGGVPWRVWRPAGTGDATLGIFAEHAYPKGHEVERCIVHTEPASEIPNVELRDALYSLGEAGKGRLIFPYGWCLLYNDVAGGPEAEPSLSWELTSAIDEKSGIETHYLSLRTARPLQVGDEMTVRRRPVGTSAAGATPARDVVGAAIDRLANHVQVPGHSKALGGTSRGRKEIEDSVLHPPAPTDLEIRPDPDIPGMYRIYALREFAQNDIIEISPGLVLHYSEMSETMKALCYKTFTPEGCLIMLGIGSLVGHEDKPSMTYHLITSDGAAPGQRFTCTFVATRKIEEGEELSINYHGEEPAGEDASDMEL